MAFTKLTGTGHTANGVDYVSKLVDKPNDVGGLDADGLKAVFDQAGLEIQNYLNNTLTAELEAVGGAGKIGVQDIGELDIGENKNIQAALVALYQAIEDATAGMLLDGSVTTAKLYTGAVTTDKLADNAVTAAKIKDGEVGANELASNAVETAKIKDGAVTTAKLGNASVTAEKLASNSVGTDNLKGDLLVPVSKGGTGATTADGALSQLGAQKAIQSNSFSLTVAGWTERTGGGWTQTVTVTGLTGPFIASPSDETSWKAAQDANLFPPTAGSGSLTFTCDEKPEAAITVTVYFW